MKIADRKQRIDQSVKGHISIESELDKATTHADLDLIENSLESAEACADEDDLFDD